MDNYANLAKNYDKMKNFGEEKLFFFKSIFDMYTDPLILDSACGTGYDMEVFINEGYTVVGSDLSSSMLGVCRKRFEGKKIEVNEVNFEKLAEFYHQKFDVILCLSNSINEIHVDPIKALKSMRSVLSPQGTIIIDQGQTDYSLRKTSSEEVIVDTPDFSRKFTTLHNADIMTVDIIDKIKKPKAIVVHNRIKIKLRLEEEWQHIIDQCSLKCEFLGWWDKSPYDKESSKRLIIIAQMNNNN